MIAKQPDIKIPKPPAGVIDDLAGLIRRILNAAKKVENKTVIGIHGSPTAGLKRIDPRIDPAYEWGDGEIAGMFSQIVNHETGGPQIQELNKLARHYATRKSTLPKGTGSIYLGKQKIRDIERISNSDKAFRDTRVSEKSLKVKKELTLADKTEEQQLAALEKFLKRQGIRIYK